MSSSRSCVLCGSGAAPIAASLSLCRRCILTRTDEALRRANVLRASTRRAFGLPPAPPRTTNGVDCTFCAQSCRIGADERGFCGLRAVRSEGGVKRLRHLAGTIDRGLLHWYRDPLPTNCVADWVCAGSRQPGRHNLAVFYASCTLDCLFCQNWRFRETDPEHDRGMSAAALAGCANADTFCVCFFGGDPASQMPHALAAARALAGRGVRVCWETAGTQHPAIMNQAVELSLRSGGTVKFDLKAYHPGLHAVLTGADNARTLANFARASKRARERPEWPLVIASTLLVPGYVTADEVERIARFIADIDPDVPYALLAFAPQFLFGDLLRTSRRGAEDARLAALAAGLHNVRLGNQHLLW